jgi:4-diphosphocytidyl-2-C-methyl-D-erythritol kinase
LSPAHPSTPAAPVIAEPAPAKVNLDLLITGRRPDGYHELDSLVVFVELADRLTFHPRRELHLELGGPFAGGLAESDNLVLRAARLLAAHAGRPAGAGIALDKRIPLAAGLGGGSADAAAALRGLRRLWRLEPAADELAALALRLGADVPVCLAARPARMRGIGEILEPIEGLPRLDVLLVNPGVPLPTAAVFAALGGRIPEAVPWQAPPLDQGGLVGWLAARANHLEAPARRLGPAIDEVLAALRAQPGCQLARLSGSGATCFGLFPGPSAAAAAATAIATLQPDWWVQATRTR